LPLPGPSDLAAREDDGVVLGGLAASTAARSPDPATAVLVSTFSTIRAKANVTPRTAPSSAPMPTRSWPRRRSDRSTGPPRSSEPCLGCRRRPSPNPTMTDSRRPLGSSTELVGRSGVVVACRVCSTGSSCRPRWTMRLRGHAQGRPAASAQARGRRAGPGPHPRRVTTTAHRPPHSSMAVGLGSYYAAQVLQGGGFAIGALKDGER
jgi:hypothetical protein